MVFKRPRGTIDWYGNQLVQLNEVADSLKTLALRYGFEEIVPPTFESLDLFYKSVGETTDVVQKEIYTFVDKKGRQMALRPEGTSSVVRAYVEEKMFANKAHATKFFYFLNLFRYERPQSGRWREFHQFGIEYLNVTSHLNDIECLIMAHEIIKMFQLEKYVTLKVNYLGNFHQRQAWMEELKVYFNDYYDELTPDSQQRLNKNPLRILDDKVDGVKDFVKNAPKLQKFLTSEDQQIFQEILTGISSVGINYLIDDSLVRGLDYYTGLVFEFVYLDPNTNSEITIIGGGRYSDLVKQTGGPDEIGLGFAIGIERLLTCLNDTNYHFTTSSQIDLVLGFDSYQTTATCFNLISELRNLGLTVSIDYGNFKKDKNAKYALKKQASYFMFINQESLVNNTANIEELTTNKLTTITLNAATIASKVGK